MLAHQFTSPATNPAAMRLRGQPAPAHYVPNRISFERGAMPPSALTPVRLKVAGVPEFLRATHKEYNSVHAAGAVLFRQGDSSQAVYYVCSGKVAITVVSQQGKEGVLGMLSAGDFVGEGSLTGSAANPATATAATACEIMRIPCDVMRRMVNENAQLAAHFMAFLLRRTMQVEADLVDHLFNSSEKRLARILILMSNFDREGGPETIPSISQELLAQRVGTTRSRINFFMNKFRRLGLIEYNGWVKVNRGLMDVVLED